MATFEWMQDCHLTLNVIPRACPEDLRTSRKINLLQITGTSPSMTEERLQVPQHPYLRGHSPLMIFAISSRNESRPSSPTR